LCVVRDVWGGPPKKL